MLNIKKLIAFCFILGFVFLIGSCRDGTLKMTSTDQLLKDLSHHGFRKYDVDIRDEDEEKFLLEFKPKSRASSEVYVDAFLNPIIICLDSHNYDRGISIKGLKKLKLIQIKLSKFEKIELSNLPELKVIKVRGINIDIDESPVDFIIYKLPKLKTLDLWGIKADRFFIDDFPLLKTIDLFICSFKNLSLRNLPELSELKLRDAKFEKLSIDRCKGLMSLIFEKESPPFEIK